MAAPRPADENLGVALGHDEVDVGFARRYRVRVQPLLDFRVELGVGPRGLSWSMEST